MTGSTSLASKNETTFDASVRSATRFSVRMHIQKNALFWLVLLPLCSGGIAWRYYTLMTNSLQGVEGAQYSLQLYSSERWDLLGVAGNWIFQLCSFFSFQSSVVRFESLVSATSLFSMMLTCALLLIIGRFWKVPLLYCGSTVVAFAYCSETVRAASEMGTTGARLIPHCLLLIFLTWYSRQGRSLFKSFVFYAFWFYALLLDVTTVMWLPLVLTAFALKLRGSFFLFGGELFLLLLCTAACCWQGLQLNPELFLTRYYSVESTSFDWFAFFQMATYQFPALFLAFLGLIGHACEKRSPMSLALAACFFLCAWFVHSGIYPTFEPGFRGFEGPASVHLLFTLTVLALWSWRSFRLFHKAPYNVLMLFVILLPSAGYHYLYGAELQSGTDEYFAAELELAVGQVKEPALFVSSSRRFRSGLKTLQQAHDLLPRTLIIDSQEFVENPESKARFIFSEWNTPVPEGYHPHLLGSIAQWVPISCKTQLHSQLQNVLRYCSRLDSRIFKAEGLRKATTARRDEMVRGPMMSALKLAPNYEVQSAPGGSFKELLALQQALAFYSFQEQVELKQACINALPERSSFQYLECS